VRDDAPLGRDDAEEARRRIGDRVREVALALELAVAGLELGVQPPQLLVLPSPRGHVEAGDERGWTGADALKKLDLGAWEQQEWGPVRVAHTAGADTETVRMFWNDFGALSGGVWRLSIRRDNPHLELKRLPSYSPHLNVIERLWRGLRRRATHNRLFAAMAALRRALRASLCYHQTPRHKVLSLIRAQKNVAQSGAA
jgi:hypothetical protein